MWAGAENFYKNVSIRFYRDGIQLDQNPYIVRLDKKFQSITNEHQKMLKIPFNKIQASEKKLKELEKKAYRYHARPDISFKTCALSS